MVVDSKDTESLLRRVAKRNKAISPTFYLFISFYLFLTIRTTAMLPAAAPFRPDSKRCYTENIAIKKYLITVLRCRRMEGLVTYTCRCRYRGLKV